MTQPLVSVVIPTHNERHHIRNCLNSLCKQEYGNIEIIVVDNYSHDGTADIAKEYTPNVLMGGSERSEQRNRGIWNAKGEYILFLDADHILAPWTIEYLVETIRDTGAIGLYIPETVLGKGLLGKIRKFERSFYDGTVIDCIRFFDIECGKAIGGFNWRLVGPEDWDFNRKMEMLGSLEMGCPREIYGTYAMIHNELSLTLKEYLKKKSRYVADMDTYVSIWGAKDEIIRKQLGLWYRYFGVFFENGKWKRVIRHPFLFLGVLSLRIGVGLVYLWGRRKHETNRKEKPSRRINTSSI